MSHDHRQSDTSSLNTFKFTSSHATPKDARERARYRERSRSPQRDRVASGRYDRNEEPSTVRSPSDASPHGKPNRPVTSRSNTLSNQPPPQVGIRIQGLTQTKADKERKQREEEARIYNANAAQLNSKVNSEKTQSAVQMAIAPVSSEASVDPSGLCWKEKAEATEITNSRQDDGEGSRSLTVTQLFVKSLEKIIDEVSELSSLKTRRKTAAAKLEKAKAEFEKSRDHHEKFPSIKETQNLAKKAAEKDYKKADEQLKLKHAPLHQLATLIAEQIVPSILGAGSSTQEQQKTQIRLDALEKTCESYKELLQNQRSYLAEQQKATQASRLAAQESERKYNAIAEDMRNLREEAAKEKPRQDKFFQIQNEFSMTTTKISNALGNVEDEIATLAKIQIPANLNQQLQKLKDLDALRTTVKTVDERSATTEFELATLITKVITLDDSLGRLKTRFEEHDTVSQTLAREQKDLRGIVSDVDNRVKSVELKITDTTELDKLKQRVTRAETATPQSVAPTVDPVVATQMATLEKKSDSMSSKLTELQGLEGNTNVAIKLDRMGTAFNEAVERISKIEKKAKTLEASVKGAGAKSTIQPNTPNLTSIESRLAALERFHDPGRPIGSIESRISAVEKQQQEQQRQTSLHASEETILASTGDFNDLSGQIAKLKEDLRRVDSDVADMLIITGETVKETVDEETKAIQSRLAAFENSMKAVREQIQGQNQAIIDTKNSIVGAAAGSAIEIIKSQSIFAPATIDDKFMTSLNSVNSSLIEHVEAQSLAIGNLQHRMDNLNTSDVHIAMVNSLNQSYPSLRNSEITFQTHSSQLSTLNLRIHSLQKELAEIREAQAQAQASALAPPPVPSPPPAPVFVSAPARQDEAILKGLRLEVDELAQDSVRLQRLEKELAAFKEETAGSFAVTKEETAELSVELASKHFEVKTSVETLSTVVSKLDERFTILEKKVDGQKQQLATRHSSAATINRNAFQGPGPSGTFRQASVSTTRQASVTSDTSSIIAKRKLSSVNGNGGPSSPQKINGSRSQRGTSTRGSPNAKRPRRSKIDDDSDLDPNYEDEGDPQPGISADEEEDHTPVPPKSERIVIDLSD